MNKNIFRVVAIVSALVVVGIAVVRIKKAIEQQHPRLPQVVYTVSSLRFQAYTSAFKGQQCTVKGTCIEKKADGEKYIVYIKDSSNALTIPLKCQVSELTENEFRSLQLSAEIVVSGKLAFADGLAEITDGKIISISKVTGDTK